MDNEKQKRLWLGILLLTLVLLVALIGILKPDNQEEQIEVNQSEENITIDVNETIVEVNETIEVNNTEELNITLNQTN